MIVLKAILSLVLVLLGTYLWNRRRYYLLSLKIPTLYGLPFLGVIISNFKIEEFLNNLRAYSEKLGHLYMVWLGPMPLLMVEDPVTIERILTSPDCLNKPFPYEMITEVLGEGLFSSRASKWSIHRKLLNPAFNHKILLDFFPIFNRGAGVLNRKFDEHVGHGEFDVTEYLQKAALNIAARTTMGKEMCTELPTDKVDLLGSFNNFLKVCIYRIIVPWYQCDAIFEMSKYAPIVFEAKDKMHKFVQGLISEKVTEYNTNGQSKPQPVGLPTEVDITKTKNIFIDQAIDLALKNQFGWDDVETESLVIVFGAFETTSNTLFFTLICLAMFPAYQERLFDEIVSIVPDKDSDVTFEHIQAMPYMEMVINETLRVMTPVPLIGRTVGKDFKLDDNVVLPEGFQVLVNIFNLHRRKDIWGPNADIFNPDNFHKDNLQGKHPYSFMPFSKGPRNCIGWRYAYFAVKVLLTKILRNYRFSTKFNFHDLQYVENITLKLAKTPLLEVHRRER